MENGQRHTSLGIVSATGTYLQNGKLLTPVHFGRVVDALAPHYDQVLLTVPIGDGPPASTSDYTISAPNVTLVPQPFYRSSLEALKHVRGIDRAYGDVIRRSEHVFVRGMVPFAALLYGHAVRRRRRPVHWIVGNSAALLKTHRRAGAWMDLLSLAYAYQDRAATKLGRRLSGGGFLVNGEELGHLYRSPHTEVTVSTTLRKDEIYRRKDTCSNDPVEVLFIGFLRPEKGLEYLVEGLGHLTSRRPWHLRVVGPRDGYPDYVQRVDAILEDSGFGQRVTWEGYVPYGPRMLEILRRSDVLVLPSLSEGTPRVLVEARANGVPVIASRVGGIPTSVTHGRDGLLVPPKDPAALAAALDCLLDDGELRRSLIRNGYSRVENLTLDAFADRVVNLSDKVQQPQVVAT